MIISSEQIDGLFLFRIGSEMRARNNIFDHIESSEIIARVLNRERVKVLFFDVNEYISREGRFKRTFNAFGYTT